MARNRKGPPDQAKHFQHDDHAHAAHQEETSHGHAPKPQTETGASGNPTVEKGGPLPDPTPKGPSRGQ